MSPKYLCSLLNKTKKMLRLILPLFFIYGNFFMESSYCQETSCFLPKIQSTESNGIILLEAKLINLNNQTEKNLSYKFTVKKTGKSGTSNSAQSGNFSIAELDSVTLSKVSIQVQPGDVCTGNLKIFQNKQFILEKNEKFITPVKRTNHL